MDSVQTLTLIVGTPLPALH